MNSQTTKPTGSSSGLSFAKFISLAIVLVTGITLFQPVKVLADDPGEEAAATRARQLWFFNQRAYPIGYIPAGAQQKALGQIKALQPAGQTVGIPWQNLGPAPIANGQIDPPGPVSGRITTIAIDPNDALHWLVGAAQGGVWESKDGGTTWAPKTDDQGSLAMGAIAFSKSNPKIVYAGTGEPNWSGDSYGGAGILKSTNNGASWFMLATNLFDGKSFGSIIVHPTNSNVLLAAINIGVAGRGVDSPTVSNGFGIFRSVDGGSNWTIRVAGYANDLQADPSNFNHQLATLTDANTFLSTVRRSMNGGLTWTKIAGPWDSLGAFRIQVAISPSNPQTAYVAVGDANADTFGQLLGIWRTDNAFSGTPIWTQLPPPDTTYPDGSQHNQMWYDNVVLVDQLDPNTLYFGGIGVWQYDGTEWTLLGGNYDDNVQGINFHPDQHALAWAGTTLVIGNDGGVFSTPDDGITFDDNNSNLSTIQFYYGSAHPTGTKMALGGSQDNGTALWTNSAAWNLVGEGDGAESAFSPSHPDLNWALSLDQLFIQRTTDGGVTLDDVFDDGLFNPFATVPFIGRLVMSPTNENIVLTGDTALIKTTNFMNNPDIYDPSWPGDYWYYDSDDLGATISAIAFAPSDRKGNTYAWGTSDGQLRVTKVGDGTQASDINRAGGVPNRYITSLVFDPVNSNTLYVALSGFDEGTPGKPGHLFRTTNAFAQTPSWTNISPAVNIPFNAMAMDPKKTNVLYVGTDIGVFVSTNTGVSWIHQGPEVQMPNVAVFDVKVQPNSGRVFAFTHGRGALVLDTNVADLVLLSTNGPDPAIVSTPYVFYYTITNKGPKSASNTVFTANFSQPVGVSSVTTSQGSSTSTSTNVMCNLGTISNGAIAQVTITVAPSAIGYLTNSAFVISDVLDPFTGDNAAQTVVPVNPADVGIGITGQTNVWVGYPVNYTIYVTNFGPLPATTVTVVDTLPGDLIFSNATASQGTFVNDPDAGTVTFSVGYLDVNYVATLTITGIAPTFLETLVNTAVVTADEPDVIPANNQAMASTEIIPTPPPLYNVSAVGFPTAAVINWYTLSNGTAQVAYGLTTNYSSVSTLDPVVRTNHSVLLTGLLPDMLYYFQVSSVVSGVVYTATGTFTTTATLILQEPDGAYFGDWTLSSALPDKYGSFYQYAASNPDQFSPTATAAFNGIMPQPGHYDVSMWFPSSTNNTVNCPVFVISATGTIAKTVNEVAGGFWLPLGSNVNFPDGAGTVQLQNNTGEQNKLVIANAVKFAYVLGQDKATDGSVPPWWSLYYLGTNSASGSADADGDGYSNYAEYVLGTTPNDSTSALSFTVQSTNNTETVVFAPYVGGRVYSLQYRADLNSPWSTLPNAASVDANGNGVFTLNPALAGFLRLQVSLAQ